MKKALFLLLIALIGWIGADLFLSRQHSLREFHAEEVGLLDANMWRSYYERKRVKLFLQLSRLMRTQFHAPFWRSFPMAFEAVRAATTFQDGRNREDYARALPYLERYFARIFALSDQPFEVKTVARNELEWWIIRREPEPTTADWERVLADVAAELYQEPAEHFSEYARLRVQAMALRDEKGQNISEEDWGNILSLLKRSWTALYQALH